MFNDLLYRFSKFYCLIVYCLIIKHLASFNKIIFYLAGKIFFIRIKELSL